jgi:ATPase subunit of ABC transporter with duplicated ATPase domains
MLTAHNIKYIHPDRDILFENISLSVTRREKAALIGNNGTGKSTLLKILAGVLQPSDGAVHCDAQPYYIPQHFGQYNDLTLAQALKIEDKLAALHDILRGNAGEENLTLLADDWTLEERVSEALAHWNLQDFPLTQPMATLSGGEKTKVFLAGIRIHEPDIVLLDEPTNHLDAASRKLLYDYVSTCSETLVVVSHDRFLLNLLNPMLELNRNGISVYGGNYDFFKEQKEVEEAALFQTLHSKQTALRKAVQTDRETIERKQKLDARGKKKQIKMGTPKVMMNTLRNRAENATARLKDIHSEKIAHISEEVAQARQALPFGSAMKMDFKSSELQRGKVFVTAQNINVGFGENLLFKNALSFEIRSGDRVSIRGGNSSGKTTLLKTMLGMMEPTVGTISRAKFRHVYIDQDYSLISNNLTVYEQAQAYNFDALEEHEVKLRLNRFLFGAGFWEKPCSTLSGGEKMRLMLCCLMLSNHAPELFVLDEPTNNLDIQNIEILTSAIAEYKGTVFVVSHDSTFLEEIGVESSIDLG